MAAVATRAREYKEAKPFAYVKKPRATAAPGPPLERRPVAPRKKKKAAAAAAATTRAPPEYKHAKPFPHATRATPRPPAPAAAPPVAAAPAAAPPVPAAAAPAAAAPAAAPPAPPPLTRLPVILGPPPPPPPRSPPRARPMPPLPPPRTSSLPLSAYQTSIQASRAAAQPPEVVTGATLPPPPPPPRMTVFKPAPTIDGDLANQIRTGASVLRAAPAAPKQQPLPQDPLASAVSRAMNSRRAAIADSSSGSDVDAPASKPPKRVYNWDD